MNKYMDEVIEVLSMCTNFQTFMEKCEYLNLYAHYDEYYDEHKGHYFIVKVLIPENEILEYCFFQ